MARIEKLKMVGKVLLIEGEILRDGVTNEKITEFYKELMELPYDGFEINSNSEYSIEYEIGVRRAGFVRPLAMTSCPLSIIVDISKPVKYSRNWKYNYRKASKLKLEFIEIAEPKLSDCKLFAKLHSELALRKSLNYSLDPEALKAMLDCNNMRLFFVKHEDNIIAGNVIYVNLDRSYDIYAANSNESIQNGATRYIVQSIIEKLKQEGVKEFDFGRIPPSSGASDGVYKFKNSIVGEKIQYNGEWSYYRNPVKEYIMHLGRRIIAKQSRY
jgi:hypothetical protein